jgi:hypothetical protein
VLDVIENLRLKKENAIKRFPEKSEEIDELMEENIDELLRKLKSMRKRKA